MQERIELDIGGKVFATTKSTLLRCSDSFFSSFVNRWNGSSRLFVDRSPAVFALVLDFLRGEPPPAELLSEVEVWRLLKDADFYSLPSLRNWVESVHWTWQQTSNSVVARHEGAPEEEFEMTSTALFEHPNRYCFAVRLDSGGAGVSVGASSEDKRVLKLSCFGCLVFGSGVSRAGVEYDNIVAPRHGLAAGCVVAVEIDCSQTMCSLRWTVAGKRGAAVLFDTDGRAVRAYVRLSHPGDQVTKLKSEEVKQING